MGDAANIRQGDNFRSIAVPAIMSSRAYQNNGAIIIWWDESEEDSANDNPDDLTHTIGEIVISPQAHPNVNGVPFASQVFLTHWSDLRTMQEIFHVTGPLFLGDAVHADDLSGLFAEGAIPYDDDDDAAADARPRKSRIQRASRRTALVQPGDQQRQERAQHRRPFGVLGAAGGMAEIVVELEITRLNPGRGQGLIV
jgi:hypothetical protein